MDAAAVKEGQGLLLAVAGHLGHAESAVKPRALDFAELPLPALGVLLEGEGLAHWVKVAGVLRASAWRWSLPASERSSWAS